MEPGQAAQLEHILRHVSVGVAILKSTSLHIRYANPYILAFLDEPWCYQNVVGLRVDEVLPAQICDIALPLLRQVSENGQPVHYTEVPYEGSLETRGRTYWQISIEPSTICEGETSEPTQDQHPDLLVIAEDVTDKVRSRLHLQAIHSIISAIAGPSALHHVLDRILQALQDLVGANRCAVLLIDPPTGTSDMQELGYEEVARTVPETRRVTIAAQKGIHIHSAGWHPLINRRILLGQVMRERKTLVFTDTSTIPNIDLPFLDDDGKSRRPGSVLCVPIFEPYLVGSESITLEDARPATTSVLGTIEVYHRRPRGFPVEEVELLQRFAQQAGLAIQNARLFRSIDHLARTANRNARQKENVMQAIPDAVVILDPRWRIADANSAARKLFGWSNTLIGLTIKQALARSKALFPPEWAGIPSLAEELERRALAEQVDEIKIVATDQQLYTMRCSYTPIQDEEGDLFAFIIIFHDVTGQAEARERIEAEVVERTKELEQRNEALNEARAEQELLLERLPSGVILVSAHNNTISVINNRAVQILQSMGLPLEPSSNADIAARRAIGLHYEPLLRQLTVYGTSGTETPFEEQPLYRALHFGEASEAELHSTKTDGRPIYLLVNSAPLRSPDGAIASALLVLHEISRMKALELAREDFFTTMAHELKTPLANIRAHLTALLSDDLQWSGEAKHDMLETADEQVERLVGMVNSFLDASRVEAGALRLEFEAILLPELLEDLQDRLEALITSSGRYLQILLPEHLPAIRGDYELILSVLTNLLSNAFRYAPEGDAVLLEVQPVIEEGEEQPQAVTLSVTDRGQGMSQEQQMELFTRFSTFAAMRRPTVDRPGQPVPERRRGAARWSPATGLGLYISRGIIEAHNSTLTLKSSPGQGATFAFTLPVFAGKKEYESEEIIP
ncbi:MAG: PAS domain-containing protein [Ktedonobacteraceae bacterium]|nr:PAS domain-containing protein [Ktedonobacteraceae bacterium]